MRVALLTQPKGAFPPRGADSVGLWTAGAARELARRDEVVVHARRGRDEAAAEEAGGVRVVRVDPGERALLGRALARLAARARGPSIATERYGREFGRAVAAELAVGAFDVVHVPNLAQLLAPLRAAAPEAVLALHMHSEWLAQLPRELVRARLAHADLVLGVSEHVTSAVRARFPELAERCATATNGVDVERFRPCDEPRRDLEPRGGPRLLYVGRVSPEKGLHVLLEAFELLFERLPAATLDVVGPHAETPPSFLAALSDRHEMRALARLADGTYLQRLRARTDPRVLYHVRFRGALAPAALPEIYRRADVVVGASLAETFGMSALEAMASGVPVVATRVGGVPEVVEDGRTGLLVEPGDAPGLAAAIERVARDEELARELGRAGRVRAEREFAWPRVVARLRALYRRARERRRGAAVRRAAPAR